MKKFKKIMALLMAMAMVLGMSVTSLAADTIVGNSDDVGSITVQGADSATLKVEAYRIIKAKYANEETSVGEDDGYFSGYANVYEPSDTVPAFVDAEGRYIEDSITEENLAKIRACIANSPATGEGPITMNPVDGSVGTYKAENAKVGTYLVVISGSESKIYGNMVVSVRYANADGTTDTLEFGNLTIENADGIVKIQNEPAVDKKIVDGDDRLVGNSANIGDELQFEITADIPTYSGENPVYKVTDTLTGLKLKNGTLAVKVRDKDTKAEVATITAYEDESSTTAANDIVLNFVTDAGYILKEHGGKELVITYTAVIDKDVAQYNADANINSVVLTYSNNSNVDANEGTKTTEEKKTKTYTFDLSGEVSGDATKSFLTKTGETNTSSEVKKLEGAVFELYKRVGDVATGNKINYTNDVMSTTCTVGTGANAVTVTRDTVVVPSVADGKLIIRGLAEGTYFLKEVKAPTGYSLSDHEYVITVDPTIDSTTGELTTCDVKVDGKPLFTINGGTSSTTASISDKAPDNGNIPNTKLSELPSTGGIGTTIFTIGGCAIMIIAAGLYFASRRRSAK